MAQVATEESWTGRRGAEVIWLLLDFLQGRGHAALQERVTVILK